METVYKVHPAVGVMRVGNSTDGYFLQGERLEDGPFDLDQNGRDVAFRGYKEGSQRIRRQGARFRVFEYRRDNGRDELVREITPQVARIAWRVDLSASKAAGPLMRDGVSGGHRVITPHPNQLRNQPPAGHSRAELAARLRLEASGVNHRPAPPPLPTILGRPIAIGEAHTDAGGRLIVLGGAGAADSWGAPPPPIGDYLNNPTWYDDIADGPVDATLFFLDGAGAEGAGVPVHESGWVAAAPPDFAPDLLPIVSLEDIAFDALRRDGRIALPNPIAYLDDIEPILRRASLLRWTHDAAAWRDITGMLGGQVDLSDPDGPEQDRRGVVQVLRGGVGTLDDLGLTATQNLMLDRYVAGQFVRGPDATRTEDEGRTLDRAVLARLIGGGFFPGIEIGFTATLPSLWSGLGRLTRGDFTDHGGQVRRLEPGMLTQRMACPWQADFCECRETWWPAQRPDKVRFTENGQAADLNWERGVVTEAGGGMTHDEHKAMIDHFTQLGVIERRVAGGQEIFAEIGRDNF